MKEKSSVLALNTPLSPPSVPGGRGGAGTLPNDHQFGNINPETSVIRWMSDKNVSHNKVFWPSRHPVDAERQMLRQENVL